MSIVSLVSGGLDSSLMSVLAKENGNIQYPLFIDYGQLGIQREWESCKKYMKYLHYLNHIKWIFQDMAKLFCLV